MFGAKEFHFSCFYFDDCETICTVFIIINEPLTIVSRLIMKQWYPLYVLVFFDKDTRH